MPCPSGEGGGPEDREAGEGEGSRAGGGRVSGSHVRLQGRGPAGAQACPKVWPRERGIAASYPSTTAGSDRLAAPGGQETMTLFPGSSTGPSTAQTRPQGHSEVQPARQAPTCRSNPRVATHAERSAPPRPDSGRGHRRDIATAQRPSSICSERRTERALVTAGETRGPDRTPRRSLRCEPREKRGNRKAATEAGPPEATGMSQRPFGDGAGRAERWGPSARRLQQPLLSTYSQVDADGPGPTGGS